MGKGGFEELTVWQKSKELAVDIYKLTNEAPFAKDFSLRDQMRRAAVSVSSNIAEGDERETDKEAIRFLYISKGSAAELLTQLMIARDIGYLDQGSYSHAQEKCRIIMRMLAALIKSRSVKNV